MGQVDLSVLADGFQPSKVQPDMWQNATCTENVLTVNDRSQEIRYAYQIDANDASRTVSFTWIPTVMEEDAVAIDAEHFPDDVLRSYVLQSLDKNGDGMLQISEQKAVTQLDISNRRRVRRRKYHSVRQCANRSAPADDSCAQRTEIPLSEKPFWLF